ncbi:MAG: AAA family ATPase [Gemmatimonadales bacterium]|nr:AAA family ATPase [Gemmatimonadales bacterium]
MPGAVLTLIGSPSVAHPDGERVTPQPGAKGLALLAYLTLEPHPHTREALADLLWGESPEVEARASLRQVLKHLRASLGGVVHCDRQLVELAEPVRCDVVDFLGKAELDPEAAVAIDVPRFLAGFSIRHAPQFDDWVAETRSGLLQRYVSALGTLARDAMDQRHWREAVERADRWLACDRLSEEAARATIEARYLAGDRGAALAKLAEYRAALLRETGCAPSTALIGLGRRIESDAGPVRPGPGSDQGYARAPSFEASLIGRAPEWNALVRAWKDAVKGGRRIVLIEGEAGIGKSRLVDEFLRTVVAGGATVLRGRGYDATATVPFAPIVEALRCALDAPGLAGTDAEWLIETGRLLPELRQRFPGLAEPEPTTDPTDAWRLYEGIAQLIASLAGERPLVISVDDLQWCDEDSCKLIQFLVRRLDPAPILWLGTTTLGELERDAPAARLCRTLRAKADAETIPLAGLREEEVWQLVREMGHVSTPTGARRFARRIYRITDGNPFYILELIKTMFVQGLLAADDESGEWKAAPSVLEGGKEFPLSRTVHDVIAERVDRLPEELGEVLITVAVAGGAGCRPEVISHVHGISRLHAAAVCDGLAERLLLGEGGGVYRCLHPVIAHVVRDGLTPTRRREVHHALAASLEVLTPATDVRSVAGEVARHAERGGDHRLAYRSALLASEGALLRFAFAEALTWLDLASAVAGDRLETDEVDRRTAALMETAGWSETPATRRSRPPVTREIVGQDLDLPVRG